MMPSPELTSSTLQLICGVPLSVPSRSVSSKISGDETRRRPQRTMPVVCRRACVPPRSAQPLRAPPLGKTQTAEQLSDTPDSRAARAALIMGGWLPGGHRHDRNFTTCLNRPNLDCAAPGDHHCQKLSNHGVDLAGVTGERTDTMTDPAQSRTSEKTGTEEHGGPARPGAVRSGEQSRRRH